MIRFRHAVRQLQAPIQRSFSAGSDQVDGNSEDRHPIRRTLRLLGRDMRRVKEFFVPNEAQYAEETAQPIATRSKFNFEGDKGTVEEFQTHCDVLVIGGGSIGSSIAFWLKEKARTGLNVVVVEKDDKYTKSAIGVSVAGLSQHFSVPENIQMSLFGADFLRDAHEHFGTDIPLNYAPHGQLVLASAEDAATLQQTSQLQNELGARNELLTAARLTAKFPWLNVAGVELGCLGLEREGWFDPWALLSNLRRAASGYGAHFVHGEVIDFVYQNKDDIIVTGAEDGSYESLDKAVVQLPDGTKRTIKFALCVISAGAGSADVARLAHIGRGAGALRVPLPIDARKRYMYKINTQDQNAPGLAMPMIVDTTGTFVRRQGLGGNYVCGHTALPDEDANSANADIDPTHFDLKIKPALVNRVPAFADAQVVSSLTGFYGYNVYDENGILGPHPYYHNLYIATGFSGQGIQQAPAVGRAISEMIIDGQFRTLDLSRLSFDRLIVDKPMYEFSALN